MSEIGSTPTKTLNEFTANLEACFKSVKKVVVLATEVALDTFTGNAQESQKALKYCAKAHRKLKRLGKDPDFLACYQNFKKDGKSYRSFSKANRPYLKEISVKEFIKQAKPIKYKTERIDSESYRTLKLPKVDKKNLEKLMRKASKDSKESTQKQLKKDLKELQKWVEKQIKK